VLCALSQPKGCLLLLHTAAFIGATLCGIIHPHGYAVRLFNACENLAKKSTYFATWFFSF